MDIAEIFPLSPEYKAIERKEQISNQFSQFQENKVKVGDS